MRFKIIGNLDYLSGYLKTGHFEAEIEAKNEEEVWEKLKDPEFVEVFQEDADLVVDDWSMYDMGDIVDFDVEKISDDTSYIIKPPFLSNAEKRRYEYFKKNE